MKLNKLFCLLTVMLCAAFACAAFLGCFGTRENIESIQINAYGFDDGAAEIAVAQNCQSVEVIVELTWQNETTSSKKLNVTWEFIGDDLDCAISVIDPGCTKGRIAYVNLGGKTGKVVLRATAKSKNEVVSDLTIWIDECVSGLRSLEGVTMPIDKMTYPTGTSEINVVWKNDTSKSLTFGEYFYLEKKVSGTWVKLPFPDDVAFILIGYMISPFSETNHTYRFDYIYGNLEAGEYRVATYFFDDTDIPVTLDDAYWLFAEFSILDEG